MTRRKRNSTNSMPCWRRSFTPHQDAALLAEMLSLPNDGRYPALELTRSSGGKRRWKRFMRKSRRLTRKNPVLMIFEDAHWIDPTSLEAFGRAVDRIATLRVLLIITYRPEFEPPWIGQPHVTALTLNRLDSARNRRDDRPRHGQ